MRETLQEAGDSGEYVYFPTSGIISMLTVLENGMMIEFATVGREGTSGIPITMGLVESNLALISQLPGEALRMHTADFLACVKGFPAFAEIIRIYGGVMFAFLAQSAACNRAHIVDERLARWLLMTHDQAGGDDFRITQEFLAQMLGVSRPSVALSAAVLHKQASFVTTAGRCLSLIARAWKERPVSVMRWCGGNSIGFEASVGTNPPLPESETLARAARACLLRGRVSFRTSHCG